MLRSSAGAIAIALTLSWGAAYAIDITQTQAGTTTSPAPGTPVATGGAAGTTAAATAPAGSGGLVDTLTDLKKYFTITADVREEYDDNVFTTQTDKISSLKEEISPSILFSYPMEDSTFDARYTLGFTYINHAPNGQNTQQDHDVVLRYNHSFSDRFNLDIRDDGGYHIDPSLLQSIGTVNQLGGYYDNIFTAEFTAQWTPLFGTVTSYSNNFIYYENGNVGADENSDENTISQDFRFAFWPTVSFAAGLIYDSIDYFQTDRGYVNYTADTGFDWQTLPSLSVGFRLGGSLTQYNEGNGNGVSPYASANINWQLGERSRLVGSYAHTITPSDVQFSQGSESDRFTANFLYNITENITTHLEGDFTHSEYDQQDLSDFGGVSQPNFSENVSAFDTGATYHYNQYLDFEAGYIFSIVDSQLQYRNYTRNQVYIGVRGTY